MLVITDQHPASYTRAVDASLAWQKNSRQTPLSTPSYTKKTANAHVEAPLRGPHTSEKLSPPSPIVIPCNAASHTATARYVHGSLTREEITLRVYPTVSKTSVPLTSHRVKDFR